MDPLAADELIDDRALTEADDDRFRHADFAVELAAMVTTVKTPANIALFAPWGSGKSGLANLLRNELAREPGWGKKLRFARFDAFKYAETPLRRNFIAEMARTLGVKDDYYRGGLYESTTTNRLRFQKGQAGRLITAFGAALAIVLVATLVVVAAVAVAAGKNLSDVVVAYLVPAVPLSAIITGFVALATRGLNVTATTSAPSTAEEFETRFRKLLRKVDAERVVIFVDELDRCAPNEVASTLETIKTFLEVEHCVFIVAADHQVLEQALRKQVRQQTPHDVSNPYYSAGSSYLDKVFQFQLALPQLKPRRLTDFALNLVRERPGAWQRIDRLDDVISVLIPSHVTSPRRVKVLLNSFAITYRLAERRAEEGALDASLSRRAAEVARLVCLRCEFPLFADELHHDIRLIEALQYLGISTPSDSGASEDGTRTLQVQHGLPLSVAERAVSYFHGDRPVAELLATDDDDDDDTVDQTRQVQQAHAQQLIRYLLKTRHVDGPHRDLVHLEGSSVGLALEPTDADDLERAAVDDDFRAVEQLIEALDEDKRPDALRLLAQQVGEALPGVEGDNVTAVLLRVAARFPNSVKPVVDSLVVAVNQHQRVDGPREDSYAGALLLARMRGGVDGARLREQVLERATALDDGAVRLALLDDADSLPTEQESYLAQAATRSLLEDPDALADHLDGLAESAVVRAISVSEQTLVEAINAHYDADAALSDDESELDEERVAELRAARYDGDPAESLAVVIDALAERKRYTEAEQLVRVALAAEREQLLEMVEGRLARLTPLESDMLVLSLLRAASRRPARTWPEWLAAAPEDHQYTDPQRDAAGSLAKKLWTLANSEDPPEAEILTTALAALTRAGAPATAAIAEELRGRHGSGVGDSTAAEAQAVAFDLAFEFAAAGITERADVTDVVLEACADTLRTPQTTPPASQSADHTAVSQHVLTQAYRALPHARVGAVRAISEALTEDLPWMDDRDQEKLQLVAAVRRARLGDRPPSVDWVATLADNWGQHVADAVGEWLEVAAPALTDARTVLQHLEAKPPSNGFAATLRAYSSALTASGRFELIEPVLVRATSSGANHDFLRAVNFTDADPGRVAEALVEAFEAATNDDQRRRVLKLWQTFGPAKETTRKYLAERIWLPLAESGATGLRTALDHFMLVTPAPRGLRDDLIDRLRAIEVSNEDLAKALDRKLQSAGWIKKTGFLGRGRRSVKQ